MEFSSGHVGQAQGIVTLFAETFAAAEGAAEGELIGAFVKDLIETTPRDDLFVFRAHDGGSLVGCAIFSRLSYDQDDRTIFILSPVAVAPDRQRAGIGQGLLHHGLDELRRTGVDIAITYGDPAYYGKLGFHQITEAIAQAPLALSQPHGWLAQSLTGDDLTPLAGPARCVPALNNPDLW